MGCIQTKTDCLRDRPWERITKAMNRLRKFLFKRIILVLTILFCLGLGIALSSMSRLSSNLIESQALQNATLSAKAVNQARFLYSADVVNRVRSVDGITVTHDYLGKEGTIPNPATYTIELGSRLTSKESGSVIRLYSDYPFPHRQKDGGAQDKFEREALEYLNKNPTEKFFRQEKFDGRPSFRYAEAVVMEQSCIGCHNSHPESPKTDWKVGDVRGILQITQPVDGLIKQARSRMRDTFIALGGISLLSLAGLTLVIGRLRNIAKELEISVRERTWDLNAANQDLEKRNQLISQIFGRYLSAEVVETLLEQPENFKIGGDRKTITILTSDLRGFTALSENLAPEEVVRILNLYLEYMSDIIGQYQGTIDKFMGDGILVLFGAPNTREDDTERAVACAVAMQLALVKVNQKVKEWGYQPLQMGIGINTGDVVVGNIGSEKRTDYSVVGSHVNLAYRIESYTIGGQIFISESTFEKVKSIVRIDDQKQVKAKGVVGAIPIYQVGGIGGRYNLFLPREEEDFFPLEEAIPLKYTILEGKHIGADVFAGSLAKLSPSGALICSRQRRRDDLPPELSNIKLNLFSCSKTEYSDDIYAKVTLTETDNNCFYIRFTAQPPDVEARLHELYESVSSTKTDLYKPEPSISKNRMDLHKKTQVLVDSLNKSMCKPDLV